MYILSRDPVRKPVAGARKDVCIFQQIGMFLKIRCKAMLCPFFTKRMDKKQMRRNKDMSIFTKEVEREVTKKFSSSIFQTRRLIRKR